MIQNIFCIRGIVLKGSKTLSCLKKYIGGIYYEKSTQAVSGNADDRVNTMYDGVLVDSATFYKK